MKLIKHEQPRMPGAAYLLTSGELFEMRQLLDGQAVGLFDERGELAAAMPPDFFTTLDCVSLDRLSDRRDS